MAPTIADGVVLCGGDSLSALDPRTGAVRWRVAAQELSDDSRSYYQNICPGAMHGVFSTTPLLADGVVYVGDSFGFLYAIDIATGATRWGDDEPGLPFVAPPLVLDDMIWAGSINKRQFVFSVATGEALWHFKSSSLVFGSALYANGLIYFADESHVYAMPREDVGSEYDTIWEASYFLPHDMAAEGAASACSAAMYVVDGYPTVKVEYPETLTSVQLGGNRLFVASRSLSEGLGYLAAIDPGDGGEYWIVPLGTGNDPFVALPDRVILAEGPDVVAIAAESGEVQWRAEVGLASAPTVANRKVYVGGRIAEGGVLSVLNLDTGERVWDAHVTEVEALGSPVVAAGLVVAGSVNLGRDDNILIAFDDPFSPTPGDRSR